jgi:hypothetical protein
MGRLGLGDCFGERDVVMKRILFLNCRGADDAVIADTNVT